MLRGPESVLHLSNSFGMGVGAGGDAESCTVVGRLGFPDDPRGNKAWHVFFVDLSRLWYFILTGNKR